ncbi:wall-associated receptor kinase-like 1 [Olea europaea subsp. europaea]|uniref:Wall-associated receptor kinase-like 1 n=1 Tax=Olea europaea subsp. europaea TaxID=158383 RepID=A0A8S0SP46_OLEEU|nr:wall-associated receptor kinase-like 1 [Olea europaea subsp. europaea]
MLVYEFLPNRTLFDHIHDKSDDFPMTRDVRLRITTEIAGAHAYLHFETSLPIYHRDIKSSSILLDENYKAKVLDFGISRSVSIYQTHLTTTVKGTFGYFDPEYFQSNQFTDKSDVYRFGVVLVELLSGQELVSSSVAEDGRSLVKCFLTSMEQNCLTKILDPKISKHCKDEEVISVANIAYRCLNLKGIRRPTMKEVATDLENIRVSRRPTTIERTSQVTDTEVGGSTSLSIVNSTLTISDCSITMSDTTPLFYPTI